MEAGKLVRVHISEAEKHDGRFLYEAIVDLCRVHRIAGATVFRGVEGFGDTAPIHRPHLIATDAPLSVVIVDSDEKIKNFLPALERLVDTALIILSRVQIRRLEKTGDP
jgi:PII-like signaling protein